MTKKIHTERFTDAQKIEFNEMNKSDIYRAEWWNNDFWSAAISVKLIESLYRVLQSSILACQIITIFHKL